MNGLGIPIMRRYVEQYSEFSDAIKKKRIRGSTSLILTFLISYCIFTRMTVLDFWI